VQASPLPFATVIAPAGYGKTTLLAGWAEMDCIWVLGPVLQRLGAMMQSAARYPNIKAGQDFTGYA
jgi:hypothetical protein